jgi:hypothetical protein
MDLRLIRLTKKTFRMVQSVRQEVFIGRICDTTGCSRSQAVAVVDDLVVGGYILLRGYGTATLVFAGPNIDSDVLRAVGIEVPRA